MELIDLRVLLVDDNPQALKILKMVLWNLGVHRLFTAKDGRSAWDLLCKNGKIDLIICDWEMPRMTGLELLQQVRTRYPEMSFLMVTGNTGVESVKAAKEFGVSAYVSKPFTPQQMREKIAALAERLQRAG